MNDIEEEIDRAAECLPDGYQILLKVEKGSGWVEVKTPDGKTTGIEDDEACFAMLISQALECALLETRIDSADRDTAESESDYETCDSCLWAVECSINASCNIVRAGEEEGGDHGW